MNATVKKSDVQAPATTEPKVLKDLVTNPQTGTIQTPTAPAAPEPKAVGKQIVGTTDEQKAFIAMTMEQRWAMVGGESARGAVSQLIRRANAMGFSKGDIATLIGKRYQHVRNVLTQDAVNAAEAERRAKAKAATETK
jgi:hypothetical protein